MSPEAIWPLLLRWGLAGAILQRLSDDLTKRLDIYGVGPDRFGLIHADLWMANLLRDGDRVWVIDFDDCGFGWWMYDFAAAVSFIEGDPKLGDFAAAWIDGYRGVAPHASDDVDALLTLAMLRRMLLTVWVASRADSDTVRDLGGSDYTAGSVALAERFLADGPARFFN